MTLCASTGITSFAAETISSGISDKYVDSGRNFYSSGWVDIQNNGSGVYHYTKAATYLLGMRKSISAPSTGRGKVWATNSGNKYMANEGFYTRIFYGK